MNSINDIKAYYLDFVRSQTNRYNDHSVQNMVVSCSERILDFIINCDHVDSLLEVEYGTIKKIVGADNDKDIQYTLHLLALEPHDVLKWVFYVEGDYFYESEREYIDTVEMARILREKNYYNPITGEKVSKAVFSKIVSTVFKVTDNFKSNLNRVRIYEVN